MRPDENDRHRGIGQPLPEDPLLDAVEVVDASSSLGASPNRDESQPLAAALDPAMARFRRRADGIERPIALPWENLNTSLGGGLWPGVSFVVGATGTFKTALALEIAAAAAMSGVPVLYVGLELAELDIVARLVGLRSGVPWSALWNGSCWDRDRSRPRIDDVDAAVLAELRGWPFRFVIAGPHGWDYTRLTAEGEAMRRRCPENVDEAGKPIRGSRPFLVVLDYLQIIGSPPSMNEELRERIRCASYAARALARDLDAAVLVLSSTSRENAKLLRSQGDDDKDPPWTQLPELFVGLGKESGEIEYSADAVLVLVKEHAERGARIPLHVAVAKLRAGQTSWCALRVEPRTLRIEEPTDGEREDQALADKLRRERKANGDGARSRANTGATAIDLVDEIRTGTHDAGLDDLLAKDTRSTVRKAVASRKQAIRLVSEE